METFSKLFMQIFFISAIIIKVVKSEDIIVPANDTSKPISIKLGLSHNIRNSNKEKCNVYIINTFNYKVGFHIKNFKNIEKVILSDKLSSNCGLCSDDAEICQTSFFNSKESNLETRYINFFTKHCFQKVYATIVSENTDTLNIYDSSFEIDSNFYGEACFIKSETHLDYCGQSSIEDCRNCKRPGCSVVECGNFSNDKFVSII